MQQHSLGQKRRTFRSRLAATLLLLLALPFVSAREAEARDLTGRLGLGFNSEFTPAGATSGLPGVSVKYALARDLAAEVVASASTADPVGSVAAIKFFKNLFFETNLNFYFTAGGGMLASGGKSGAVFLGAFGTEFFIPGLESVGFSFEAGGTLDNVSGTFAFQTLGASFLQAGMHFYF